MDFEIIDIIQLELKYCERCGGLWLRVKDSEEVYCYNCGPRMADFPVRTTHREEKTGMNREIDGTCESYLFCYPGGEA